MNKIGNFLWKLFSVIMVFNWNISGDSYADSGGTPTMIARKYWTGTSTEEGDKMTLCPKGQYVYKCNNLAVGYNWLQEYDFKYKTTPIGATSPVYKTYTTHNYLIGKDAYEISEQMRSFFSGRGQINQRKDSEATILGYLCNPADGAIITCAPCPDGGTVGESYVITNDYDDEDGVRNLLFRDSWNFHTLADCYMNEFEDATGSYLFVPAESDFKSVKSGSECYYVKDFEGMTGDFVSYSPSDSTSAQNTRYYTPKYY